MGMSYQQHQEHTEGVGEDHIDTQEWVDTLLGFSEQLRQWEQALRIKANAYPGTQEQWSAVLDLERASNRVFSAAGWLARHIDKYEKPDLPSED